MDILKPVKYIAIIFIISCCVSCTTLSSLRCAGTCTDTDITTIVQMKIAADDCLRNQFIRVSTYERTVTLEGKVQNPTQRRVAIDMARTIPGVTCVISKLKVKGKYNI